MNELRQQLDALAAHVRDPDAHPGPPGIEARRLKIYSDLVYNNLDSLLAGNFPVIRKTLGDADWQTLVRGSCRGTTAIHRCSPNSAANSLRSWNPKPAPTRHAPG